MTEEFRAPIDGVEDEVPEEAKALPPVAPNQCPYYACRKQHSNEEEVQKCVISHTVRI